MLTWATSKFLIDGSTIAEERARGCHESKVTRRGSRDGQSCTVFPWGTLLVVAISFSTSPFSNNFYYEFFMSHALCPSRRRQR